MTAANSSETSTGICGFDADTILLRGKNLVVDVIGQYTITGAFLLQALGKEPTPRQVERGLTSGNKWPKTS